MRKGKTQTTLTTGDFYDLRNQVKFSLPLPSFSDKKEPFSAGLKGFLTVKSISICVICDGNKKGCPVTRTALANDCLPKNDSLGLAGKPGALP
ncbi:MAG: hypothetical protein EOO14_07100 [Chitinophagaceae bacterium]|nr:MAG: hypothetical protein EOO14_07100 [Chitinophagaceae bacterium]